MVIDGIISKFDGNSPSSYYSFETFVLKLLQHHLEEQGKEFIIDNKTQTVYDAFAPNGFDNFGPNTYFEVKYDLNRLPTSLIVDKVIMRLPNMFSDLKVENLIIITAKPFPEIRKKILNSRLATLPFKVIFWEPQELNSIVNKHRKVANNIVNNLFSLRIESSIAKTDIDWKDEREKQISQLSNCYKKGQFSLFLGAGVSSSAGLPNWNKLLNSLFVEYLTNEFNGNSNVNDDDINEIVNRLNHIDGSSALIAARYLRKGLSRVAENKRDFINAVTKSLYKLRDKSYAIDSELIISIGSLCTPKMTGSKVKSVITYNFDDLLERQLGSRSLDFHSIFGDSETYERDELPIYHVHGFIPENDYLYERLEDSTLVFSEEGYHHIYMDSYHWSNLVQLNCLKENNCLMIGLSMSDPNLRRLLDIASRNTEKTKHFAFMQRITDDIFTHEIDEKTNQKIQIIKNVTGAKEFLKKHHILNEEIMKELGVAIIWYEDYDEVPILINKIKEK
jgi:hypothetical protein